MIPTVKELVRDRTVLFRYYRDGALWYQVIRIGRPFIFPVPVSDTGTATFLAEDRAILFMRWIRKHREQLVAEESPFEDCTNCGHPWERHSAGDACLGTVEVSDGQLPCPCLRWTDYRGADDR